MFASVTTIGPKHSYFCFLQGICDLNVSFNREIGHKIENKRKEWGMSLWQIGTKCKQNNSTIDFKCQ